MTLYRLHRAARLAHLIALAWCALLAFEIARPAGFARLCAWVRRRTPALRPGGATPEEIIWSVDEACVWYVRRALCLQRSVVATWLLRRHGFPAETVIGCRPLPFESHAWVEIDGRIVNDLPQYKRAFTVLHRL